MNMTFFLICKNAKQLQTYPTSDLDFQSWCLLSLRGEGQNGVWGLSSMCAGVFEQESGGAASRLRVVGFWMRLGLGKFLSHSLVTLNLPAGVRVTSPRRQLNSAGP